MVRQRTEPHWNTKGEERIKTTCNCRPLDIVVMSWSLNLRTMRETDCVDPANCSNNVKSSSFGNIKTK